MPHLSRYALRAAVVGLLLGVGLAPPSEGRAQANASAQRHLQRQLQQKVTLAWQGQRLQEAIERLAATAGIAVWLDRRVDPHGAVDHAASQQSVGDVLERLAAARGCGATPFRGVVYFGPQQTASELATLSALAREDVARAPAAVRQRWLKAEAWSCPRLSEPRQLLRQLVESAGGRLAGEELVPHDLWPARDLPPLAAIDKAVLILAGFDLTGKLSPDGSTLTVVPVARPVHVARRHTIPSARRQEVDGALAEMPTALVEWRGTRLTLAASVEEHDRIARLVDPRIGQAAAPPPEAAGDLSAQRFTLQIERQPVGRVIDQLALQLQLSVQWDESLAADPAQGRDALVSCSVQQADLDGLLQAVLMPAGLAAERDGQAVRIHRLD